MENYVLTKTSIYHSSGSSEGTQAKYYSDGKWFKQDLNGYEGETEYLASCLLDCSNIVNYVEYKCCTINGKSGCVSDTFLRDGEAFITFERLHQMYTGQHMADKVMVFQDVEERLKYVKDFVLASAGVDVSDYLSNVFAIDALTLNYDRHFNNLGIVYDGSCNKYKEAPIFDNGAGFLSNITRFPVFKSIEENIESVAGQPLCANLDLQAYYSGIKLRIDYEMLEEKYLKNVKQTRALEVVRYQLNKKRGLFKDFKKNENKD